MVNTTHTKGKKKYRKRIVQNVKIKLDAFTEKLLQEKERIAAIRREERKKVTTYVPTMGTRARFSLSDYVPQKGRYSAMAYQDSISRSIYGTFNSLSRGALGGGFGRPLNHWLFA